MKTLTRGGAKRERAATLVVDASVQVAEAAWASEKQGAKVALVYRRAFCVRGPQKKSEGLTYLVVSQHRGTPI